MYTMENDMKTLFCMKGKPMERVKNEKDLSNAIGRNSYYMQVQNL